MQVKYDKIGVNYNQTRKADKYITNKFFEQLCPDKNGIYLDLGCGTGNYTIELFKLGINIIGIDPSEQMLLIAKTKCNKIKWEIGTAENIGLAENTIDGIICCLTIHHWTNINAAFLEISRILKPKGKIVIFTSTPEQMEGYWLNRYFPKMLSESKLQMPSFEKIKTELIANKFENIKTEKYFVSKELEDYFLYCGKHRPNLYLKPEIRNGISSFTELANSKEIERGLFELSEDMKNGYIDSIIKNYNNKNGDYLFIMAQKTNKNK